jgi:superfamily II DNA or RNA helicase
MEFATALPPLSFGQEPRIGQLQVLQALETHRERLSAKLPTGYGKTYTCCMVYSILRRAGRVTRLLVVFPTDAQLDQFMMDAPREDLTNAQVEGPHKIIDIRFSGEASLKDHRTNAAQIYLITIQALIATKGSWIVNRLLQQGQWMICVDEHHHYGEEKTWGKTIVNLNRAFLLVMSATPHRPTADGAFGQPDVVVTYQDAYEEGAVKALSGHAYHYMLDLEDESGQLHRYTTQQLAQEAGGDDPDKIEKLRIKRKMRWTPKYVWPLISIPIDRMLQERLVSGFPLQVLITAMCVSHAEYVCNQLRDLYPELRVDWVGTGDYGRESQENKAVLEAFCPPKKEGPDGKVRRPDPALDVLVHVGLAGEGLDSIYVSEVVHLTSASLCNRVNQINGRAARVLPGVRANINFDASSEFSTKGYLGAEIMKAMDDLPAAGKPLVPGEEDPNKLPPEPPENPTIRIFDIEFQGIDSGDVGVQRMARVIKQDAPSKFDWAAMETNKDHPDWQPIINIYKKMREVEAEQQNEKAVTKQWMDNVQLLLRSVTGLVVMIMKRNRIFVDNQTPGLVKKRINWKKKILLGELNQDNRDPAVAKQHYDWLIRLDREIREREALPEWLAL